MKPVPDPLLQVWKAQCDAGMRVVEAITEGSQKLREAQLRAAAETHATASAMRRRVGAAADARELWALQGEWASANIGAALGYWNQVLEIAVQTQSKIAGCLAAPSVPQAQGDSPQPSRARTAPGRGKGATAPKPVDLSAAAALP